MRNAWRLIAATVLVALLSVPVLDSERTTKQMPSRIVGVEAATLDDDDSGKPSGDPLQSVREQLANELRSLQQQLAAEEMRRPDPAVRAAELRWHLHDVVDKLAGAEVRRMKWEAKYGTTNLLTRLAIIVEKRVDAEYRELQSELMEQQTTSARIAELRTEIERRRERLAELRLVEE